MPTEIFGDWVAPLLMIPAMALLAISTAARYTQVAAALGTWNTPIHRRSVRRLRHALLALYVGIAVDAFAATLAHMLQQAEVAAGALILIASCIGTAALTWSAALLAFETWQTTENEQTND